MAKSDCQQKPITGGKNDNPRSAQTDYFWSNEAGKESAYIPERGCWNQGAYAGVFITEIDLLTWHPSYQNSVEPIKAMRNMPLL